MRESPQSDDLPSHWHHTRESKFRPSAGSGFTIHRAGCCKDTDPVAGGRRRPCWPRYAHRRTTSARTGRTAVDRTQQQPSRSQEVKSRALKNLTAWLTEHELPIQTATLLRAIRDTDQAKRERRGRIQAAYLLARIANVKLQVPQEEQYRKPKVPLVETVTDHQIIEAYDELRSNCRRPEVAWLMGVMITTGCRATTALTMELDGISDVGDEILAWDSKRARQTKTTPTLRGKWQAWNLSDRPSVIDDVLMPSDRPASDDQIWRANQWINGALKSARRSVSATNSEILGARSLRSATVARLLRAGASTLQAATLVSTSEEMVRERYARFFKSETVSAVSGLL